MVNDRLGPVRSYSGRVFTNDGRPGRRHGWKCIKGYPADKRQGGLQRVATVDGFTSRKRFGRAVPKGAVAGDSRHVPVDPGRVGTENPVVFPLT